MKIKNLFILTSLVLLGVVFSGFVYPNLKQSKEILDKSEKLSFPKFLSYFKKTDLPYQMELKDFKKYEKFQNPTIDHLTKRETPIFSQKTNTNFLPPNNFIPETNTRSLSRMGPPRIQPIAYFYPNKKSVAVVYTIVSRFRDNIYEPIRLLVYDLEGNLVFPKNENQKSKKKKWRRQAGGSFELGQSSIENTVTFRITEDGKIWKNEYDNIWKHDLKEKPFFENELLNFKVKNTEVFQINEQGVAEKLKTIPTDARANLD